MSAVLPHLEITPQRPDWLAGAGGFEPRHRLRCHMLTATTTTADSQAYYALAPDPVAAPRQNNRHLPHPVKRRLQILLVDQTHQFKIGGAHRLRLAIHGGTRQLQ